MPSPGTADIIIFSTTKKSHKKWIEQGAPSTSWALITILDHKLRPQKRLGFLKIRKIRFKRSPETKLGANARSK